MEVNEGAPIVAAAEQPIDAAPEVVWEVLTDLDRWPEWNPDVSWVRPERAVAEGVEFRWKAGPGTITSRFERVEPPRFVLWSGRTFGIRALHSWRIEPRDGGSTVSTAESWDGLPARLFAFALRRTVQQSVEGGLAHLKAEAERRAS